MVPYVAAALIVPVGAGILVYVAASFWLMRPHVARRPIERHIGEALRELVWTLLTQPLLPLFYVLGRRLTRGRGTPIVTVHGYMQNRVDFLRVARACARSGLGPVYGFNYPWFEPIHEGARRLARFCERVRRETGAERVDLVAHSLGGLVAMEYLHEGGAGNVRRVVTIASPHAGVAWRGPILGACGAQMRSGCAFLVERATRQVPVPCLSIYSTHDNVVHPPLTSALAGRGARDRAVAHVGHLAILFHPAVTNALVEFLEAPESVGKGEGAARSKRADPNENEAVPSTASLQPPRELLRA
jgi:pimeloyl-ACP methyl ester carboxylesterase